jgi:hypothetical protein
VADGSEVRVDADGSVGVLLVGEFGWRKASSGWFLWRPICREKEKKSRRRRRTDTRKRRSGRGGSGQGWLRAVVLAVTVEGEAGLCAAERGK